MSLEGLSVDCLAANKPRLRGRESELKRKPENELKRWQEDIGKNMYYM